MGFEPVSSKKMNSMCGGPRKVQNLKMTEEKHPAVNFINLLRARFFYKFFAKAKT